MNENMKTTYKPYADCTSNPFGMVSYIPTGLLNYKDYKKNLDKIHVCLNKFDLLEGDKEKKLEEIKQKINDFFGQRKIEVIDIYMTCGETVEGFEEVEMYNDQVAEMILKIVKEFKN